MKEYYDDYRLNNETEEIQLKAVNQIGLSIQYINNPSEEVQLAAVKQTGISIQYIYNPSEQVQLEAVKQDGLSIHYIKNIDNILNKYYNYDLYKYLEDLYYPFTEEFKESYNYKKYLLEKNI